MVDAANSSLQRNRLHDRIHSDSVQESPLPQQKTALLPHIGRSPPVDTIRQKPVQILDYVDMEYKVFIWDQAGFVHKYNL